MKAVCPKCENDENTCWMSEEDFEDIGIEGKGLAVFYTCLKCGTDIEYYIPEGAENEQVRKQKGHH